MTFSHSNVKDMSKKDYIISYVTFDFIVDIALVFAIFLQTEHINCSIDFHLSRVELTFSAILINNASLLASNKNKQSLEEI